MVPALSLKDDDANDDDDDDDGGDYSWLHSSIHTQPYCVLQPARGLLVLVEGVLLLLLLRGRVHCCYLSFPPDAHAERTPLDRSSPLSSSL